MLNEGDRKAPAYGKAVKLSAGGKEIVVNHGDSHPVAADWDKDGKLDLIVGTGAGGVLWYRNVGVQGEPKLAAPVTLVADGDMGGDPNKAAKEDRKSTRLNSSLRHLVCRLLLEKK